MGKRLLYKHEEGPDPQYPCKKLRHPTMCPVTLALGRQRQAEAVWPVSSAKSASPCSLRDPVSKIKGDRDGRRHVSIYHLSKCTIYIHSPLPHTYTHATRTCAHPPTHTPMCTYRHTDTYRSTQMQKHTQARKLKTFKHQTSS